MAFASVESREKMTREQLLEECRKLASQLGAEMARADAAERDLRHFKHVRHFRRFLTVAQDDPWRGR
jgi:hypothetical protein